MERPRTEVILRPCADSLGAYFPESVVCFRSGDGDTVCSRAEEEGRHLKSMFVTLPEKESKDRTTKVVLWLLDSSRKPDASVDQENKDGASENVTR
uniref:Uncharacterized protein n=1 Tax=Steinernema glaseri TaxID=37863 RepID=A0A1I7ZFP9_9BILA